MNKITTGLCLAIVSILLGSLFFVGGYHALYWAHPAIFITLTIVGVFSALYGGFLIGRNLSHIRERRGALPVFLVGLGALFIIIGLCLVIVSIILGSLFFVSGYNGPYWPYLAFFITLIIVGVFYALCGGLLIGKDLLHVRERRGALPVFLVGSGSLFTVVGGLLGLFAIFVAISTAIETGYWGEPFYGYGDYGGDWMFMGMQIIAFQMCIVFELIGSFLIGFGLQKRG
jgi:hypothetical protein